MGAVAARVRKDRESWPSHTFLVGGDVNVGHSHKWKNGDDLKNDCYCRILCGGKDLYDEKQALLTRGLVAGLRMKNLALGIKGTTFPGLPGSPIDNIYVTGDLMDRFEPARKATDTFGSDHLAVWTVLHSAPKQRLNGRSGTSN